MIERDMKYTQWGLVTGCFEEGHFHQGITALSQLRMPGIMPSPQHIVLLLYIALYPETPPEDPILEQKRQKELDAMSPLKQIEEYNRELRIQATIPSDEAIRAARDLLYQYTTDSVSPEAILRAVPCYRLSELEIQNSPRPVSAETLYWDIRKTRDIDSWTADDAKKISQCKDMWSMLRPGVVKRRSIRKSVKAGFDDLKDDEDELGSSLIGRDSWHVLNSLILLFEKDEALVNKSKEDRYSIIFLSQFKPINNSTGTIRSDPLPAVEIAFHCYRQNEPWKKLIGRKSMTLLISLTSARTFSSPALIATISTHLQESSHDVVVTILTDMPSNPRGRAVKMTICEQYLSKSFRVKTEVTSRARPLPSRAQKQDQVNTATSTYSWSLPSSKRVLGIIESGLGSQILQSQKSKTVLFVIFQLLLALGMHNREVLDRDQYWDEALHNGWLEQLIDRTYSEKHLSPEDIEAVKPFHRLLSTMCTIWKQDIS